MLKFKMKGKKMLIAEQITIPFETELVYSNALEKGFQREIQTGKKGVIIKKYKVDENTGLKYIVESVYSKKVNRVIEVGTNTMLHEDVDEIQKSTVKSFSLDIDIRDDIPKAAARMLSDVFLPLGTIRMYVQ